MAVSHFIAKKALSSKLPFINPLRDSTFFLTNLLSPVVSPLAAAGSLVTRAIHIGAPPIYAEEETVNRTWCKHLEQLEGMTHPFITGGPVSPQFGVASGGKAYVRIDMPGVGDDGLSILPRNNFYVIEGVQSQEADSEPKRVYSNVLSLDQAYVIHEGITAAMENGVARIVFPLRSYPSYKTI